MMMNLFNMFDPSSYRLALGWWVISTPLLILFLPHFKSIKQYPLSVSMVTKIISENKSILGSLKVSGVSELFFSLMIMIFILNFISLLPFVFSYTAQVAINFPLAFTVWALILLFQLINNWRGSISHFLPSGTPVPLMPLMIFIELISCLIRPITLSVRLTANMIAGHLLMSLLSGLLVGLGLKMGGALWGLKIILSSLEAAVSFIQSYVFMTLLVMYLSEV